MDEVKQIVDILLVEDSPNDAELVLRTLKKNNLTNNVIHVKDGEEALDFIFGRGVFSKRENLDKPKVILLDLKLPKVNGLEVLKQLKSDVNTKKIPIVVLTSSSEGSDLKTCYEYGVNSYIVKPVSYEAFVSEVSKLGLYWLLLNKTP